MQKGQTITQNFNNAVKALVGLARERCINAIPDNFAFLKFYTIDYGSCQTFQDAFLQEYRLLKGSACGQDDILNDIQDRIERGRNISWVDLTFAASITAKRKKNST